MKPDDTNFHHESYCRKCKEQMNPKTTPTPQYDSVQNWAEARDLCKKLERELAEKTNEIARLRKENYELKLSEAALSEELKISDDWLNHTRNEVERLRELLNRAIHIADEFWKNQKQAVTVWHGELADELEEIKSEARIAPSPEEPSK